MENTIAVNQDFWAHLYDFLNKEGFKPKDLISAGISSGTARKVLSGQQKSRYIRVDHIKIYQMILKDPDAYRNPNNEEALSTLDDLMNLSFDN